MRWLRHGDNTLLGYAKASVDYGKNNHPSLLLFRQLRKINLDCVFNGEISKDFEGNERPLIPIIFCHGLSSNRTCHSGSCRDLASHGYIVFAMDSCDGSSSYVDTEDGVGKFYDNSRQAQDMEFRHGQIKIRESETIDLIDELY